MKSIFLTLLFYATVSGSTGHAQGTSDGGHGGEPTLLRRAEIIFCINYSLKDDLIRAIQRLQEHPPMEKQYPTFAAVFREFGQYMVEDVTPSAYEIRSLCLDRIGIPKGAVADLNRPGTAICWAPSLLESQGSTENDLLALAFHEHLHHFGFPDTDHILAAEFKKIIQRRTPRMRRFVFR